MPTDASEIEKAAEMGREAAEKLIKENPKEAKRLAEIYLMAKVKEVNSGTDK